MIKHYGADKDNKYKEFVLRTMDMKFKLAEEQFAKENGIPLGEFQKKRTGNILEKLAAFFNKSSENYRQIVEDNPDKNFREILTILKEKGLETYSGENFANMRKNLKEKQLLKEKEKV